MRVTFLTWLFGLICAAFALAIGYSHFKFATDAEKRAALMMSTRLTDLMELLIHSDACMDTLQDITDTSALEKTRAAAEILRLNPEILKDAEALQGLCNDLGAKQLMVTDADGVVCAALHGEITGTDLSRFDAEETLRACIDTPGHEVCLRAGDASTDYAMQYAAVHRTDAPGVLILGFRGAREQAAWAAASFANLAQNYDLGERGYIIAFKDGALLGEESPPFPTADIISQPLDRATQCRLGDADYFIYAIRRDGYRLVGLMPVSELRSSSLHSLYPVLTSNAVLIVAVFLLVLYLLQRLVLRNIAGINASLKRITQGNLDERIESENFPVEFRKLSSSINSMVDALQTYGRRNDEASERELDLARTIQNTIIPQTFPAFPLHTEFDLYATCRRAKVVGGGFYDYFLLGDNYLCFMVADASGSGVPAALFAIHSVSIIRELALSGATPIDLLATANSALCDKKFVDMYLSLFFGMLEIRTGKLVCVNAGHTRALVCRHGSAYNMLDMHPGMELGRTPDAVYTTTECRLEEGDRLFVYTEGVVEAADAQQVPFGETRLYEALAAHAECIADVPRKVMRAQRKHTQAAEQLRDSTALALEYIGRKHAQATATLLTDSPDGADAFLAEHLESVLASPLAISALQHAVQSIAKALPPGVEIVLTLDYDEESATLTLHYPPPALNPLLRLSRLPADRAEYVSADHGGNTIILRKSLA